MAAKGSSWIMFHVKTDVLKTTRNVGHFNTRCIRSGKTRVSDLTHVLKITQNVLQHFFVVFLTHLF